MRALFIDTAVVIHALGGEHPLREPCRALIAAAGDGEVELHASVELVQEVLHVRGRRVGRTQAGDDARAASQLCWLHPLDTAVLRGALELHARYRNLDARDAIYAATALHHGFGAIVSPDRGLDGLAGLRRLDPVQAATTAPDRSDPPRPRATPPRASGPRG